MNIDQVQKKIDNYANQKYKYGFETIIESERPEKGLNEDIIRFISAKKKEHSLELLTKLNFPFNKKGDN